MAGKFEIYKDKAGEFRFRLKAGNGENLLASEGYKSKTNAKNGIASVQKNCSDSGCFEKKKSSAGRHRFTMKAKNRQVIATGQSYDSESGCDNGIKAVGRAAKDAQIVDLTQS